MEIQLLSKYYLKDKTKIIHALLIGSKRSSLDHVGLLFLGKSYCDVKML